MAEWSTALQNTFPDSSFAWIAPGGTKDGEGKTVPRTLRHLVYKDADGKIDAAHTRNSLARLNQVDGLSGAEADRVRAKLEAALAQVNGKAQAGRIEYKTLALSEFKMLEGDGPGEFEGYGSVHGNKDSQGDICDPGCFRNAIPDFLKNGFIADNHNWPNDVAMPIAAVEDSHGLLIRAQFHSDPAAQQRRTRVMERMAAGKSVQLSIGYGIRPGGAERKSDGRHLTDLTLYEVSIVAQAANPLATLTAAKAYMPGMAGMDAEPPEGSYEELAEDLAEAYAAANGLPEERVMVVATFPGHAVICVCPDYSGDMGPMGETEYWDVPYSGTDEPLTLGTPTAVDPQLTYVPSDDAKGLWLPLAAVQAELKAGARHGKPTRERYDAMAQHVAAARLHLTAISDHIGSLQAESVPQDGGKAVDGHALYGEYLAWEARRLGVAV